VQDRKGKTTNTGRTGDTGVVTSLRIQEEKHQCGKASNPKEEKEAGGRQQPCRHEDLFKREATGGPPPPHSQLRGEQRLFRCPARDRTHADT